MTSSGAGIVDAAGICPGARAGAPGVKVGMGWSAGSGVPGDGMTGGGVRGAVRTGGSFVAGTDGITGTLGTTIAPGGPLGMAILFVLGGVTGRTEREGSVGSPIGG